MIKLKRVKQGQRLSAEYINSLVSYLESLKPISTKSIAVDWKVNGVAHHVRKAGASGGAGLDLSKFDFGYSETNMESDKGTVAVNGGYIKVNRKTLIVTGKTVSVTGGSLINPMFICVKLTNDTSAEIMEDAQAQIPADTVNETFFPLHSWYYDGIQMEMVKVHLTSIFNTGII